MLYILLAFLLGVLIGHYVGHRGALSKYASDISADIKRKDVAEERARKFGYRMERKPNDRRRPE